LWRTFDYFFIHNKVICKVGQTRFRKPIFCLSMRHNFKYSTKNYTRPQHGMKFRYLTRFGTNSISCQMFYLCIAQRSSHLSPLLLCPHLHHLCLLTSYVYLNAHTLSSRLASIPRFPKVVCFFFLLFHFFYYFIHAATTLFALQTTCT
jgi:hypothetical protein